MLCGVPLALLELWEVLYDSLHIFNRFELGLTLLILKEFLN
jgi:hypothetical protein